MSQFDHKLKKKLNDRRSEGAYLQALEKRVPGSGLWVFADPSFANWQASRNSLLWMHGPPACGKTVLSATIIDYLLQSPERPDYKKALAFFFFSDTNDVEQTVEGFLSSVLVQLCAYLPSDSTPTARQEFVLDGVRWPSSENLLTFLIETLSRLEDVYIIVDALDECSLDVRRNLISTITQLRNHDNSSLHLLISSRRNNDLQDALRALYPLEISIDAERIEDDVSQYVYEEVQNNERIGLFDENFKSQIVDTVVQKSQGMFLWATMQIEELQYRVTKKAILDALESTPEFLGTLYNRLFNEINEENKPIAIIALQWLAFSVEPLTVDLLAEAVVLDSESLPIISDEDKMIRPFDIVDILQNMVTVSGTSNASNSGNARVHLIHQSLGDFLQDKGLIEERHAHYLIAESCLQYIAYYANSDRRLNSKEDFEHFPILLYACKNWTTHVRRWMELPIGRTIQSEEERCRLKPRVQRFLSQKSLMDTWLLVFDPEHPAKDPFLPSYSETQPLSYAASTGIPEVVIDFVQRGADVNAGNFRQRRPLHNAVAYGIIEIAATLIDLGADPMLKDCDGKTPLLEAAMTGRANITRLLFDNTDFRLVHMIDDSGSTVLHDLVMEAPGSIFNMLVDSRKRKGHPRSMSSADPEININHRDQAKRTLLHKAVEAGNISVIIVLLSKGADLNAEDENKDTPLHFAVRYNQEVAKETLINHGALPTMRNAENKTALELSWAKKSLKWDLYQVDGALTSSTRISLGAQAECHVLKKEPNYTGPDFIFRKTYNLVRMPRDERREVYKALLRENQILQRLEHPFIVSYLGYEEVQTGESRLYLEYCDGGDLQTMHVKPLLPARVETEDDDDLLLLSSNLSEMISDNEQVQPLTERQVWTMLYQLFAALAYLHYGVSISAQGACGFEHHWDPVVHRDIKPHNVVLATLPDGSRVSKLCDLGVARRFVNMNQSRASDRGSRDYSPPEVFDPDIEECDRKWTSKGDVFSLGKTIDRLYKSFTPIGPLKDILEACQHPDPILRPSSLTVLEVVHRQVDNPFPSLTDELGHGPGGFVFQAFFRIAKNLDVLTFGTTTSTMQRKKLLARLELLLKDGAEDPFRAHCRSLHLAVLLSKKEMLRDLLSEGQNPDEAWPNSGWTPLHLAVQEGEVYMAQALLEASADPKSLDYRGYRPVDYNSRQNHQEMTELLLEFGNPLRQSRATSRDEDEVLVIRKERGSDEDDGLVIRNVYRTDNDAVLNVRKERKTPNSRLVRAMMATLT